MYKFRNPIKDFDENQENQIEGIISSSISMITCKLNEIMRIFNNQMFGIQFSLLRILTIISIYIGEKVLSIFLKLKINNF